MNHRITTFALVVMTALIPLGCGGDAGDTNIGPPVPVDRVLAPPRIRIANDRPDPVEVWIKTPVHMPLRLGVVPGLATQTFELPFAFRGTRVVLRTAGPDEERFASDRIDFAPSTDVSIRASNHLTHSEVRVSDLDVVGWQRCDDRRCSTVTKRDPGT